MIHGRVKRMNHQGSGELSESPEKREVQHKKKRSLDDDSISIPYKICILPQENKWQTDDWVDEIESKACG